ncbi:hypothetical protein E2C01_085232 [Portunus trituberculatus]|uniref:Uncharacterized protein n=1 Tax=Portunus trituberculatus TaxID=210409 RepID=A0A5B7J8A6_PORTR|nr:hypothetical protein [Portunus trituberculatus]
MSITGALVTQHQCHPHNSVGACGSRGGVPKLVRSLKLCTSHPSDPSLAITLSPSLFPDPLTSLYPTPNSKTLGHAEDAPP